MNWETHERGKSSRKRWWPPANRCRCHEIEGKSRGGGEAVHRGSRGADGTISEETWNRAEDLHLGGGGAGGVGGRE